MQRISSSQILNLAKKQTSNSGDFPFRAPESYLQRINPVDPNDPLLRQILPSDEEQKYHPDFKTDPVDDSSATIQQGLLQKYQGRVLIMTTGACPIHCRYCFRRHFNYNEHNGLHRDWSDTLNTLSADTTIKEVILSGGDPLSLTDHYLAELVRALDQIPHITRLRIHTRYPVVAPERVNDSLLSWLEQTRLDTVMVIHCNHANEIDTEVNQALHRLRQHRVTLLNQSVLLKGVNDNDKTLVQLSEKLFEAGVLPYYLHMLDKVQGAAHFDVEESKALELVQQLRHQLPGYLVPKLVREVAGTPYKQPISDPIYKD